MFEITSAKRRVLEKLVQRDWTPTELAEELDRSTQTAYNHLEDLADSGVLTKRKIESKTRPKTQYSIGNGFIQYVALLPGEFSERVLELDHRRASLIRIWNLPQDAFHPVLEEFWYSLCHHPDVDLDSGLAAAGVYGSVARGEAGADSDVDVLLLAEDERTATLLREEFGSEIVQANGESAVVTCEVYSVDEYQESWANESDFLREIAHELRAIYDPERRLKSEDAQTGSDES